MTIYTLRMPKAASALKESHVFEAKPGAGKGCICLPKALCQKALTADTVGVEGLMCLTADRMRASLAGYAGAVCAACLAALSGPKDKG